MFHMLTCFNLRPGLEIDELRRAIGAFAAVNLPGLLRARDRLYLLSNEPWPRMARSRQSRARSGSPASE